MNNINKLLNKNLTQHRKNNNNIPKSCVITVDDLNPNYNPYLNVTDDYVINKIKNNEYNENKKIKDLYKLKYNECLVKINNAIDTRLTDIIFQIPFGHFGCKTYNSMECLQSIQDTLRKKNFNTLIIANNKLFVSWKNSNF
jgi:hypothetical protein